MVEDADERFPFATYPKGWFQVAYSRDVEAGQVIGLHYFGRRLIGYRGGSGTPYVLDAYCPHLGADITVGGTVTEDCIVARYTFFVQTNPDSGEMSRMGLGFARDFCKQIEQDIPIWENKIYRERPQLARGESAISKFRAWAWQSCLEALA